MAFRWLILLLGLLLTGSTLSAQTPVTAQLSPAAFKEKLAQPTPKIVLDVRTAQEVAGGQLPGAVNIDFYASDFARQIARLDTKKPVFVYCAVGGRSGRAMLMLQQAGFKTIYNLAGGMQGWQQAGYPLARKTP